MDHVYHILIQLKIVKFKVKQNLIDVINVKMVIEIWKLKHFVLLVVFNSVKFMHQKMYAINVLTDTL